LRFLVTGGAGFIGSNFVIRSIEARKDVEFTIIDSLAYAGALTNLDSYSQEVSFLQGDIRDADLVDALISVSDLVVHFAAESHNDNSLANPNIFYDTDVMGTLNIANSCVRHGVRLHHISTDEVFGDLPLASSDSFMTTTADNPSSPYSASKAASDHLVRAWVCSFGLQGTISNCSNNYGPRHYWEEPIPNSIRNLISGARAKLYGSGLNIRDWIHVDDHVDGIWLAIDNGQLGATYLFGARDTQDNVSVVSAIVGAMGLDGSYIELVRDRPSHDLKYLIHPTFAESKLPKQKNPPSTESLVGAKHNCQLRNRSPGQMVWPTAPDTG